MQDQATRRNTINDEESGSRIYTRPDPYTYDQNDPNDPRRKPEWELMQGIAVKILHHKTGAKYPMWLWFSQVQTLYLRMYEEISSNFLIHHKININPATGKPRASSPFFIDGKGAPTYHVSMQLLDFSDFRDCAGVPKVESMTFRKILSNVLMSQEDITLRECEKWTMCHAPSTDKSFYADELSKKMKAVKANAWYQDLFKDQ